MEWLNANDAVGNLTEDNLEHCAVALYEKLAQGQMVVGEVAGDVWWTDSYASGEGGAGEEREEG